MTEMRIFLTGKDKLSQGLSAGAQQRFVSRIPEAEEFC